jgi:hypothetical protein
MRCLATILALVLCVLLLAAPSMSLAQSQFQVMDLGSAFNGQPRQGDRQPAKQAQQVRRDKQQECARRANEQSLRGNDRQRFMRDCLSGN